MKINKSALILSIGLGIISNTNVFATVYTYKPKSCNVTMSEQNISLPKTMPEKVSSNNGGAVTCTGNPDISINSSIFLYKNRTRALKAMKFNNNAKKYSKTNPAGYLTVRDNIFSANAKKITDMKECGKVLISVSSQGTFNGNNLFVKTIRSITPSSNLLASCPIKIPATQTIEAKYTS